MARLSRLVIPGHPHHVVQRGNNRQPLFFDPDDQRLYLEALREASRVHSVAIHAYALLESEVQLLATPSDGSGLSKMIQSLGRRYVAAFNRRHERSGSPFDGRYRATVVDSADWFVKCMVFIETAPARAAAAVTSASARPQAVGGTGPVVPVSSAPHHLGRLTDPMIWEHPNYWSIGNTPFEREAAYKLLLEQGLDAQALSMIQRSIDKGWPLGSPQFVAALAHHTTRRLVPLKRGRRPNLV
jgi:putative transposase